MSTPDPQEPVKPTVLQPGEGGPKPRTASGVDRTDVGAPAPKRERKFWDIALSIVLMLLSIGAYLTGALIGLLGIAVFGNCPTGTCGGETVTTTGLVLLGITILGIAATIFLLWLRLRGWWLAAVLLGTIIIAWIISYALSAFGR
ncbi:MAG: hypothetical protein ABIQ01_03740 [Pseudolysinimonas sp.]